MSDKPTGVFVRFPLSEAQIVSVAGWIPGNREELRNEVLPSIFFAIGTTVTGGELEVVAYDNLASGHLSRVKPVGPNINLVRQSDALAKLAEKDAEIAKLREYYAANEEINRVGIIYSTREMFDRMNKARAALKDPEA